MLSNKMEYLLIEFLSYYILSINFTNVCNAKFFISLNQTVLVSYIRKSKHGGLMILERNA
jgi:hypothetical protein